MELKIYSPSEDGFIKAIEWNHEEIKKEVSEKVAHYATLVYTDEQIREAKADKATLNNFVTALENKRKEIKKQCLAPYDAFEKQMKEIIAIVQEPITLIDRQIKEYEDGQRQAKLAKIKEYWNSCTPPIAMQFEAVYNPKWLNATVSMKSIHEEIAARLEQVQRDLDTIRILPEFAFEAEEVYKSTLDVNKAIHEAHRMSEMAKAKARHEAEMKARAEEQERARLEALAREKDQSGSVQDDMASVPYIPASVPEEIMTPPEPEAAAPEKELPVWICFKACLTTAQAAELKAFFESRNISFEAI